MKIQTNNKTCKIILDEQERNILFGVINRAKADIESRESPDQYDTEAAKFIKQFKESFRKS